MIWLAHCKKLPHFFFQTLLSFTKKKKPTIFGSYGVTSYMCFRRFLWLPWSYMCFILTFYGFTTFGTLVWTISVTNWRVTYNKYNSKSTANQHVRIGTRYMRVWAELEHGTGRRMHAQEATNKNVKRVQIVRELVRA